jgi:hypothetical protein
VRLADNSSIRAELHPGGAVSVIVVLRLTFSRGGPLVPDGAAMRPHRLEEHQGELDDEARLTGIRAATFGPQLARDGAQRQPYSDRATRANVAPHAGRRVGARAAAGSGFLLPRCRATVPRRARL